MEVDVTELDFGETDTSKTVAITNAGGGALEWSLYEEEDWLGTDAENGILEAGLSETITVEVDRSAADTFGLHAGSLTITSLDMIVTIEVSIVIPDQPRLMVSPPFLDFGSEDVAQELSIGNSGTVPLEWSITSQETWLSLDPLSGTTEPGTVDVIQILVDRSAVEELGNYSDVLNISSNGGDSSVPLAMEKSNHPPNIPTNSSPADGVTNQSLYTTLSCQGSDADKGEGDELTYDIYFSSQEILVESEDSNALACYDMKVCYCDPGMGRMANDTTYYWKVVAKDSYGEVSAGEVWSFSTEGSVNIVCPAFALGLGSKHYTSLRRLRDEILARDHKGRYYIETYYRHGWDLFIMLLFHHDLRTEGRRIAEELYGVSQCLLEDGETLITGELLERVTTFLEKVSRYAKPELKMALRGIKADLQNREKLQAFGIVTTDN